MLHIRAQYTFVCIKHFKTFLQQKWKKEDVRNDFQFVCLFFLYVGRVYTHIRLRCDINCRFCHHSTNIDTIAIFMKDIIITKTILAKHFYFFACLTFILIHIYTQANSLQILCDLPGIDLFKHTRTLENNCKIIPIRQYLNNIKRFIVQKKINCMNRCR